MVVLLPNPQIPAYLCERRDNRIARLNLPSKPLNHHVRLLSETKSLRRRSLQAPIELAVLAIGPPHDKVCDTYRERYCWLSSRTISSRDSVS